MIGILMYLKQKSEETTSETGIASERTEEVLEVIEGIRLKSLRRLSLFHSWCLLRAECNQGKYKRANEHKSSRKRKVATALAVFAHAWH